MEGPAALSALAFEHPEDRGGVRQILDRRRWLVGAELIDGRAAGANRQGASTNHPAAVDVMRRVANHPDVIGCEVDPMSLEGPAQRMRAEFVAMLAVVAECAERETVPQTMVREFQFRAPPHVSCQQSLRKTAMVGGGMEDLAHAGQDTGVGIVQRR